jgi:hypothetical protein
VSLKSEDATLLWMAFVSKPLTLKHGKSKGSRIQLVGKTAHALLIDRMVMWNNAEIQCVGGR